MYVDNWLMMAWRQYGANTRLAPNLDGHESHGEHAARVVLNQRACLMLSWSFGIRSQDSQIGALGRVEHEEW